MPRAANGLGPLRVTALLCALLGGGTAAAQGRDPRPSDKAREPEKGGNDSPSAWYGGQTLAVDGIGFSLVAIGAVAGGVRSGDPNPGAFGLMALGAATYLFGAPIVHGAHGNGGRALGSFAIRVGLPAAGAAIGVALNLVPREPGEDPLAATVNSALVGAAPGALLAAIIDSSALAYESLPPADPGSRLKLALVPSRRAVGHGWGVGMVAAF